MDSTSPPTTGGSFSDRLTELRLRYERREAELRTKERALARHAEFDAVFVNTSMRLLEETTMRGEDNVRVALAELNQFHAFSRAALMLFSDGEPREIAHHSPAFAAEPSLLAQVREREARFLRAGCANLRDQRWLTDPSPGLERLAQSAPPAFAVPLAGSSLHALVCHPTRSAEPVSELVAARLQSFGRLLVAGMSPVRAAQTQRTDAGNGRAAGRPSLPPPAVTRCFITSSSQLQDIVASLDAVAPTRTTVLIQGESGVGKELVARTLHDRSPRAAAPLITVNCASIARELFESEFFGHTRGAFTGAHRDRVGRFEMADGGTLFLDEVGEIPLELQAKLLRVLQEGEFDRIGEQHTRRVDTRVVAATNRDLAAQVQKGTFREDLYYRLSVYPIHVPPLRERPDDILALGRHFLEDHAAELGRHDLTFSADDERLLLDYEWPGNVRELYNVIVRAVIRSPRSPLRLDLPRRRGGNAVAGPEAGRPFVTASEFREHERANVMAALTESGWRVGGRGGAAELLGVRPSTLRDRLNALGIQRK